MVLAGLAIIPDEPLNLAQTPQRLGFIAPVTKAPSQSQGLGVVLAGLAVFAHDPLNVPSLPER